MDFERIISCVKTMLIVIWEFTTIALLSIYVYAESIFRCFVPRSRKNIAEEIILLTGSANGIGKELAFELARSKATIVCWDIEGAKNDQVVAELKRMGTKAYGYTVDISKRENVAKAAEQVRKEVGNVTMIFNNAGIAPNRPFLEEKDEILEKIFQINLLAHFWILKEFLPKMIEKNHGHIVTTASLSSLVPAKEIVGYASSKHGVHGYIESLRQEIRDHYNNPNIKFTTVYPSFINTRLLDGIKLSHKLRMPQIMSPEYVAKKIIERVQQDYEYVILPPQGVILPFLTMLPYAIQKKIQDGLLQTTVERTHQNASNSNQKLQKSK